MSDTTSINKSFLSNNKYELIFDRLPNTIFFLQSVNLPSITLNSVVTPTPFTQINTPGNILSFEQLAVTYIVDENMQAWRDIYSWITTMGNPTSKNKLGNLTTALGRSNSMVSDAVLIVKSNSNNTNLKFSFKNIFPTELGSLQFTSTESQEFLTSTATFFYDYYTLST